MLLDRSLVGEADRTATARAAVLRVIVGAALLGVLVGASASAARADDDSNPNSWSRFLRNMGLKGSPDGDINYVERPPLVVPPSRDLPPPAANAVTAPADWPRDPAKPTKRAAKHAGVVPETAVQTPNPPYEKKPWYNPTGWFSKEEYANFNGEPVRQNLTDPPAGYRVPSPEQPYGINPEKKNNYKPSSQDFNLGSAGAGGGQPGK